MGKKAGQNPVLNRPCFGQSRLQPVSDLAESSKLNAGCSTVSPSDGIICKTRHDTALHCNRSESSRAAKIYQGNGSYTGNGFGNPRPGRLGSPRHFGCGFAALCSGATAPKAFGTGLPGRSPVTMDCASPPLNFVLRRDSLRPHYASGEGWWSRGGSNP